MHKLTECIKECYPFVKEPYTSAQEPNGSAETPSKSVKEAYICNIHVYKKHICLQKCRMYPRKSLVHLRKTPTYPPNKEISAKEADT